MSLEGGVFDSRFDFKVKSMRGEAQHVAFILVQKVFDFYGFADVAIGPSFI